MSLARGTRIGSYEILAPVGAGAMGEVYRAADQQLHREVALKLLPPELARDTDRMARFQREAQLLASLNHPNIAAIYGIEQNALVMELVEGETLAEIIAHGPVRMDKLLSIARQTAAALAFAHSKDIIHRDVKPANIKLTPQGTVKVLDFGIARKIGAAAQPADTPTLTVDMTQAGAIIGTAAYMSPEQAEGKPVDARSDIFSFGALLYELATGSRPFTGESAISVLSAVLNHTPQPVSDLRPDLPPELSRIIQRSLAKRPDDRWQNMGDVKLLIEDLEHPAPVMTKPVARPRTYTSVPVLALLGITILAVTAGVLLFRRSPAATGSSGQLATYRPLTTDSGLTFEPAISADGKLLAYASDRSGDGNLDIWVRQLPNGHAVRLTNDPADDREPSFSPAGDRIVFRSDRSGGGLYVCSTLGGEPRKIAGGGRQPRFSPDGKWIAYWIGERHPAITGTIWIVPSTGGEPKPIAPSQYFGEEPVWLPDSSAVVFMGRGGDDLGPTSGEASVGWIAAPIDGSAARLIVSQKEISAFGLRVPPTHNFIRPAAFVEQDLLFAAQFGGATGLWKLPISPSTGRMAGKPVLLTTGPGIHIQPAAATVNARSQFVFSMASIRSSIVSVPVAVAPHGAAAAVPTRLIDDNDFNRFPSISANGALLAYVSDRAGNSDVWLRNLSMGKDVALTETPGGESYARISRDGSEVMFMRPASAGTGRFGLIPTAGGPSKVLCGHCKSAPYGDWLNDQSGFVYSDAGGISLLRIGSDTSVGLINPAKDIGSVTEPRVSYDDRWIVFHSVPSAQVRQVFVAPLRNALVPREDWIAVTGADNLHRNATWAPDGKRVYYLSDIDGFRCIWARNLDGATKKPVGEPFAVYHSHHARYSLLQFVAMGAISLSATSDRIYFAEPEITANIWMMEPAQR